MNIGMNKPGKFFIVYLLLALIVAVTINKVTYSHVHILEDGRLISHAHPYDKSENSQPGKSHHHSSVEFIFLQNLEILFFIALLAFLFFQVSKQAERIIFPESAHFQGILSKPAARAPPVFS